MRLQYLATGLAALFSALFFRPSNVTGQTFVSGPGPGLQSTSGASRSTSGHSSAPVGFASRVEAGELQRVSPPEQKPDHHRPKRRKMTRVRGGGKGRGIKPARITAPTAPETAAAAKKKAVKRVTQKIGSAPSPTAASEKKTAEVITQKIGSAPILKAFTDRMDVIAIIDRAAPAHANRTISHGEAVVGLMAYLLNDGRALYRLEQWAEQTAILSSLFPDYAPGDWSDDRLGDTLDALYQAGLEPLQGSISGHIVQEFGINLDKIHYDTTSVSLWGTYDSATGQPAVVITRGFSKAHRPDLKQFVEGMAVSGDGGVPLISKTHDGNASDSTLPLEYWERLRQLAGTSDFCFVGDCKVASLENLQKLCGLDGRFVSTLAMSVGEQNQLRQRIAAGELTFTPVDLSAEPGLRPIYEKLSDRPGNRRRADDAAKGPDVYRACELTWAITDTQGRPQTLRKLVFHSSGLARAHAATRERHLKAAETALKTLSQKLNKRTLKTRQAIEEAANKVLADNKVRGLLDVTVGECAETVRKQIGRGRPGPDTDFRTQERVVYSLAVQRKAAAIDHDAALDGMFLMVTNQDKAKWSPAHVLSLYKRQYQVEHVHRAMKGPLAVSPMLLHTPERICAMMFVITLTLQLYTLIQRQAAQELMRRNAPLSGLMPNNIKTWRPQTDELLAAFHNINRVTIARNDTKPACYITSLNALQKEILQLLGVAETSFNHGIAKIRKT